MNAAASENRLRATKLQEENEREQAELQAQMRHRMERHSFFERQGALDLVNFAIQRQGGENLTVNSVATLIDALLVRE